MKPEKATARESLMKKIRLKNKPSFYEDLIFSHWLTNDRLLAVVHDRQNRVAEIRMDPRQYSSISQELKARHYL
jgi:hypothetical protein